MMEAEAEAAEREVSATGYKVVSWSSWDQWDFVCQNISASSQSQSQSVAAAYEKKLMAVRIIKHAMEIIHILTDANPIQIIIDAIINSGPREVATRIRSAGVVMRQAVDVSPLGRVNQAI